MLRERRQSLEIQEIDNKSLVKDFLFLSLKALDFLFFTFLLWSLDEQPTGNDANKNNP